MRTKLAALACACLVATCAQSNDGQRTDGGGNDTSISTNADGGNGDLAGQNRTCAPKSTDQVGCGCNTSGATQPCYPATASPKTRNVGACKDGSQTCVGMGEFSSWGDCTGAITPKQEICTDGIDNDCNGLIDCKDPSCATSSNCNGSCQNGQTRMCYTGPANTEGVGICHAGTQTCTNKQWPSGCPGEQTPQTEPCNDFVDHNCNGLPGCLDLFACLTNSNCQEKCKQPLDPGCVCPMGEGDAATCPEGMLGNTTGGGIDPGVVECCPCKASDCGNAGCCGETVCKGNSQCGGLTCNTLPASCKGQVNFDCDDFPEDCDEPCCKCTNCP